MKPGSSRGVMRSDRMMPAAVPPPRSRRRLVVVGLAAALGLAWWGARGSHGGRPGAGPGSGSAGAAAAADAPRGPTVRRFIDGRWQSSPLRVVPHGFRAPNGLLRVTGTVHNVDDESPTAGVEVVFADGSGEASVMAGADGRYQIDLPAGAYHAFARGDGVVAGEREIGRAHV